jgi:hypothetical protein
VLRGRLLVLYGPTEIGIQDDLDSGTEGFGDGCPRIPEKTHQWSICLIDLPVDRFGIGKSRFQNDVEDPTPFVVERE